MANLRLAARLGGGRGGAGGGSQAAAAAWRWRLERARWPAGRGGGSQAAGLAAAGLKPGAGRGILRLKVASFACGPTKSFRVGAGRGEGGGRSPLLAFNGTAICGRGGAGRGRQPLATMIVR